MNVELILKASLAVSAAGLATALMRRSSAARRHFVWMLAIGAVLALPLVPTLWRVSPGTPLASFALAVSAPSAAAPVSGSAWLQTLWLAGVVVLLARLAAAHLSMARKVGLRASGVVHADVPCALVWGLWNPAVLLPRDGDGDHAHDLAHELAHVRRGDGWWLLLAQVACAVYWFHPLVWVAARKAAQERERACDDLVLACGAAAPEYAERLVVVARHQSAPLAALGMGAPGGLTTRVRAILDSGVNRLPLSRGFAAAAVACGLMLMAPMFSSVAQTAAPNATQANTRPPRLLTKVEPDYTPEAKDAGIVGAVKLFIEIDAQGNLAKAKVLESLDEGLDQNAIKAVRQWKFAPALKDGKPVAVGATVEIRFRLE